MWMQETLLWANVLIGFFWFMKTLSMAVSGRTRLLVYLLLGGLVGASIFHLVLAGFFGSMIKPILWSMWNFLLVVVTALLSGVIVCVLKISERRALTRPRHPDEGRDPAGEASR
jgi:hypothetical protein